VTQSLNFDDLCISDVLAEPVHSRDKQLVAPEGTVVTSPLLRRIRELQQRGSLSEKVNISVLQRAG
jgi:hypothetical protein